MRTSLSGNRRSVAGNDSEARSSVNHQLEEIRGLKSRAMRARVWRRVGIVHRAAMRVVEQILARGDEEQVSRIRRSEVVREMLRKATGKVRDALRRVPQALSFKVRAILQGVHIACDRITNYRERGVLTWAPWVREWLGRRDTVYYLGSISIGWSVGRR